MDQQNYNFEGIGRAGAPPAAAPLESEPNFDGIASAGKRGQANDTQKVLEMIGRSRMTGTTAISEQPDDLMMLLQGMAHPQGLGDLVNSLIPSSPPLRQAWEMLRNPLGRGVEAAGRGVEALGASPLTRMIGGGGGALAAGQGMYKTGAALGATPPAIQLGGRGVQGLGRFLQDAPEAAAVVDQAVPPHLDLSRRVQPGGLSPAQMAERDAVVKAARAGGNPPEFGPLKVGQPPMNEAAQLAQGIGVGPLGPERPPIQIVEKPKAKTARERRATPKEAPPRSDIMRAFENLKPSPEEAAQAVEWLEAGVPAEQVVKRITASRALTSRTGAHTSDKAAARVSGRNRTGKWDDD